MEIIVHRGTHEIGGCTTELRTARTRILVDFGSKLPDAEGGLPEDNLEIPGLTCGTPDFDAVLLTHSHADHLGRIVNVPDSIPVFLGRSAAALHQCSIRHTQRHRSEAVRRAAERLQPLDMLSSFRVGDFTITPLPADHSAWDAMMFVIEADGRRILHTGDFRLHGFRSKNTLRTLSRYASNVDLIIIEGTQLSGGRHENISEVDLQAALRRVVQNNKYVFALCASTNIDRLASFHNATPDGKYFLCDAYQRDVLDIVRAGAISQSYGFRKVCTYGTNLETKLRRQGFVMAVRASEYFVRIAEKYPDAVRAYSMWRGYLDGRSPAISRFVQPFQDAGRIEYLHTSGHAAVEALQQVSLAVRPRMGILPIHGEHPEQFRTLGLDMPIHVLEDGQVFVL